MRRKISSFAICFAAAGLAAPAPAFCSPPQRRPSVLLVILDSVRADRTSPYGYFKSATPALNKLAEQGIVFENAYANSNWTGASFASILTGKRPFSHGLVGVFDSLSQDARTIQSVLSQNGYKTAAFLAGVTGAPDYGLTRGFGHVIAAGGDPMSRQVSAAIEWEKELPQEKDFFILIHGNDVHYPYHCSSADAVNNGEFPEVNGDFIGYYNGFPGWNLSQLDPSKWKEALSYKGNAHFLSAVSAAYDLCVSLEDGDILVLLRGLEAGSGRPLLVIITADHGENFGEHGRLGHGQDFFEPLVRVPLLIRFPDGRGGRRIPAIAEHVDLLPTICAAAGVACPAGLDGKDLAEVEKETDKPRKWAAAGGGNKNSHSADRIQSAAFSENGKKIMLVVGKWQLYDLAADPGETRDIAKERPDEFLKLASGYLAFSGAGRLVKAAMPEESGEDCFWRKAASSIGKSSGTASCEQARFEASALIRAYKLDAAEKKLAESNCPPADVLKDGETLKLLRKAFAGRSAMFRSGYKFSARPGLWKMMKNGFSVIYSGEAGLLCENDKGQPVTDPGCVPPAEAMLNCIEHHRFRDKEESEPRNRNLREALRKAGYIP